jgi:hypothetical protein
MGIKGAGPDARFPTAPKLMGVLAILATGIMIPKIKNIFVMGQT